VHLPATVEGHERLRLFVGLPVPSAAAHELAAWAERLPAANARRVRADDLHVTLAFLGHRPRDEVGVVAGVVDELAAFANPLLEPVRYRETRSVGMLVCSDAGGRGAAIAEHAQRRLEEEGVYVRERRPWLPHVTVLRFRSRAGVRPDVANMRSIAPSDAAAYLSVLGRSGSTYEIIHSVALKKAGR
jgi:RNA 2',3'-cyclic 3'-phosphodiesterase